MNVAALTRARVLALSYGAAAVVFVADWTGSLGVAHAMLYVLAVLPAMWSTRREDPLYVAMLCTLLAGLGVMLRARPESAGWQPEVNTALAVLVIWITAGGVRLRMRSERELRGSESELGAILQTAIDGVITMDVTGTIVSANPAAASIFGYEPDEMLGMNVSRLMPSPHAERHDEYVQRYLATGEGNIIGVGRELIGLRKDRSAVPLDLGVSEWSDGATRFTAILRDLSDRRRLEAEVRQAQKLEAIGRLAGGIAHDFNNLLMGIISCGRIAQSTSDAAEVRRQVDEIQAAAERGAALTRQLLIFSRRRDLAPEPVLIDETVGRLQTMLARLLGEHVELRVELRASHGRVLIDPGQVEQILMNLAINSRDAIEQRGHLFVHTRVETCGEPGVGSVGGVGVGRYAALEVSDDGCGMSAEVLAKAFDPFFTTKPPTEGTGLGLSTVYGLARQCGGHLHVDSAPGKGTRVTIHMPLTEVEPTPRLRSTVESPAQKNGQATILVVEDDRLVRAGVRHMLEKLGYEVLAASGGADALRICEEHPGRIDLLLTDILMPGMTGGELAREISARLPGVRRLFMSALPNEALVEQGRIPAGEPSVMKPFSDEEIEGMVAKVLAG